MKPFEELQLRKLLTEYKMVQSKLNIPQEIVGDACLSCWMKFRTYDQLCLKKSLKLIEKNTHLLNNTFLFLIMENFVQYEGSCFCFTLRPAADTNN